MGTRLHVHLERSAACAESHDRGPVTLLEASKQDAIVVDLTDGAWVQFTYETLRGHDGAHLDLSNINGCWWHDGQPWSDIVLEIRSDYA